jgi:hypothetical protein
MCQTTKYVDPRPRQPTISIPIGTSIQLKQNRGIGKYTSDIDDNLSMEEISSCFSVNDINEPLFYLESMLTIYEGTITKQLLQPSLIVSICLRARIKCLESQCFGSLQIHNTVLRSKILFRNLCTRWGNQSEVKFMILSRKLFRNSVSLNLLYWYKKKSFKSWKTFDCIEMGCAKRMS